ncbi:MAG: hypothetical protein Q9216_000370 [Gyalolechia sp. 2 TL-2023]
MASNVVVIDTSARRTTIKTTPGKILSDVLQEACNKFSLDASRHGLKHNNRNLDLSNPIRLSGLSPGAKLELVVISRSPSVVSVALQLPEEECHGLPSGRLVGKHPSNTTLWKVLRTFEDAAPHRNYTGRGKTKTDAGRAGAGRLYHEAPILSMMSRELTSFTDLQKTLAQLGYNSGSVLLRLSFRASDAPLEEALEQMKQYFEPVQSNEEAGSHATSSMINDIAQGTNEPRTSDEDTSTKPLPDTVLPTQEDALLTNVPSTQRAADDSIFHEPTPPATDSSDPRQVTVYRPPSSSTPRAARQAFNEADYEPTIRHAKQHQARLQTAGRNRTLLSDKELAEKESTKAQKLAEIKDIQIRVRFPNQTIVERTFSSPDTARSLYEFARENLRNGSEPFLLSYTSAKGNRTISPSSTERLISDLGMVGKTLINFSWDEGASVETRTKPILREDLEAKARDIEIPSIPEIDAPEEPTEKLNMGKRSGNGPSTGKSGKFKFLDKLIKK